ncbi:MAG: hypothetical protein MH204_11650 [Fimbriimonadaceae bacterium]|nr:hypothetical protein [Fimbriimonadaceae bacterium]
MSHPLRCLYLDMNAYFASVEQAEQPELRGRPVGVAAVDAESTMLIAASVECKRLGVRTGTPVWQARETIPDIVIQTARPPLYVHYHRRILDVMGTILPIAKVCSIDEMHFGLIGRERQPDEAAKIARTMKQRLREEVAENLTCSIGIAPNSFLAKLATDMQKPDGLVVLESHELAERLKGLALREFCGINRRMESRLRAAGIFRSDDLLNRTEAELERAFGSIIGRRWWHLLRGVDLPEQEEPRKSLSHSHVLPPEFRSLAGARDVLLRLTHKAAARLRSLDLAAGKISVSAKSGRGERWEAEAELSGISDTPTLTEEALRLWKGCRIESPLQVGVNFTRLDRKGGATGSLFDDPEVRARRDEMSRALDRINGRFGKNSVYLAGLRAAKGTASEKIAFQKTWLFSEGAGDQDWDSMDTFRGLTTREEDGERPPEPG